MRVLFLTSTLPRFAGDMQANFVGEQAAAWKQQRPRDEITILAPHDPAAPRTEHRDGLDIVRFRYFAPERWQRLAYPAILPNIKNRPLLAAQLPAFLLAQYRAAAKLVRERQIDLVYAHWVMPQGLIAYALNLRLGVPYVLQNHSSDLTVFDKLGGIGRSLARKVIRNAECLFVVNATQQQHALSLFRARERDSARAKIHVMPMGVSEPHLGGSTAQRYEFATVSRLSRKKGLDRLILAANALARSGERPSFAIAGDGEDSARLKALVKEADVSFPGFLAGDAKERFLEATRTFVVPSIASNGDVEGMPVALLEALCRGKSVIASTDSNITLLPEWGQIRDMVILLDDPRDREAFVAALRRANSSDWAADERRGERLRAIMARYLWPNLIGEYLGAIDSAR